MAETMQSSDGMLTQIYATVTDIKTDVAVLKEQGKSNADGHLDHETRIRSIESARAKMTGAATLAGALSGSAGGAVIGWLLSRHG